MVVRIDDGKDETCFGTYHHTEHLGSVSISFLKSMEEGNWILEVSIPFSNQFFVFNKDLAIRLNLIFMKFLYQEVSHESHQQDVCLHNFCFRNDWLILDESNDKVTQLNLSLFITTHTNIYTIYILRMYIQYICMYVCM